MELVKCSEEYWEFVRTLRLDERVIDGFISTSFITEEQQSKYMNVYHTCYRIALVDGKPAGFVGVIDDDIRVCTHPDFQSKGVGKFMINSAMDIWPTAFAKVKLDNEASVKLFEACGFTKKFFILTKD
jgi:ribosomal protein S18 acetylase RimI-like enzyme